MSTLEAIKKKKQVIAKHERLLALEKIKLRKQDTRRKIEFGGLVIKAKMDQYSKAVILGALIDAFNAIENDPSFENLLKLKGESAFMGYGEK